MDLNEFVGKYVYVIVGGFPYQGVMESDTKDYVRMIGEYGGQEVFLIIPKYEIDVIIVPRGDHHE